MQLMREKLAIAITSFVSRQDVLSFLYHDESTKQQQQKKTDQNTFTIQREQHLKIQQKTAEHT